MKIRSLFTAAVLLFACSALTGAAGDETWMDLFNGKDLTGWSGVHDVDFDVHDGNLRLVKGMGWLRTDQLYDDFILEFECKALVEGYDSGIFIRAGLEGKPWPDEGFQINLKSDALGTLVRGYRPMIKSTMEPVPVNEWMKFRLTAQGEEASLQINGEDVWEADFIEPERGLIGIQAENRSFEFRRLRIHETGYIDLLEEDGGQFKHLEVHVGPKEPWSLQNGVLTCDGEKGGWIGTKDGDFSDFILKLDYRVPKEGNSGVYIRTPKGGHGSSQGMEIQVIDDDAQHWGKLEPWQLTGAIYHEFPPAVRATKKAGQWQSMLIQAVKNQVQIFVNGVQIIDADLNENEALKDRPDSGHIGFQNYDGQIEYRNVRVKRIEE
ncbi:MAG: DUF1080 domain-containing protein [Candidatus Omnitrophica bacterium]|nr:DUF1080 domain-containing protein [Candidatus Omnitrophota bacterium]